MGGNWGKVGLFFGIFLKSRVFFTNFLTAPAFLVEGLFLTGLQDENKITIQKTLDTD